MPMEYALNGLPNHIMMTKALNIYRREMRRFIVKELKRAVRGDDTLDSLICDALPDDSIFMLRYEENDGNASAAMDIGDFHHIVRTHWNNVFKQDLQNDWSFTNDLSEINLNARVKWAHPGEEDLDAEETIDNMRRLERALQAIGSPRAQMEVEYLRKALEGAAELAAKEWKFAAAWDADQIDAEDGSGERILFDGLSLYRKEMCAFIKMRATIDSLDGRGSFESLLRGALPSNIQGFLDEVLNENGGNSYAGIDIWYFPEMIDRYWQRSFANRFEDDREFLYLAYRIRSAIYSAPNRRPLLLDAELVRGYLTLAARALELIGHNAREARAEIEEMRDAAYPLHDAVTDDTIEVNAPFILEQNIRRTAAENRVPGDEPVNLLSIDFDDLSIDLDQDLWRDVAENWVPDDPNGKVFWEALDVYRQEARRFISNALEDAGGFEELIQPILPDEASFPLNHLAAEIWAFPRIVERYWAQGFQQDFQNDREFEIRLDLIRSAFGNVVDQDGKMEAEDARVNLTLIARALEMMGASDAQAKTVALRDEHYPPFVEEISPFSGMELPALAERAGECEECVLHNGRTKVVFGEGNEDADILFLGYIPHSGADQAGRPFVEDGRFDNENRIGRNVTRIIESIGMQREDMYLTYALKCNGKKKAGDRHVEKCRPYFLRQLELIQPRVVVALGEAASRTLIETSDDFNEFIGKLRDYERLDGIKVLPTQFPTSIVRTDEAIEHLRGAIDALDR